MESSSASPLTTVQQRVVDALAAGATVSAAAALHNLQPLTVHRWVRNYPQFQAALRTARAEFVLARRDGLCQLSNRALESLLFILDNPNAPPAVRLRASMFILRRPRLPHTGWNTPEPAPRPESKKLLGSAIVEQEYDGLPGLYQVEREGSEPEMPVPAASSDAFSPAAHGALRSCLVPITVINARRKEAVLRNINKEFHLMDAVLKSLNGRKK